MGRKSKEVIQLIIMGGKKNHFVQSTRLIRKHDHPWFKDPRNFPHPRFVVGETDFPIVLKGKINEEVIKTLRDIPMIRGWEDPRMSYKILETIVFIKYDPE